MQSPENQQNEEKFKIGMLLFPGLTQLDLTGPYEVFGRAPNSKIFLISKYKGPVKTEHGLEIISDTSLSECPQLDLIFVPGGPSLLDVVGDDEYVNFLIQQEKKAKYLTSVCVGSLILGAAGLLTGYKATTHWLSLDLLELFRVEVVKERVVIDRNRITGGGITAGIDFALVVIAEIFGKSKAEEIQLAMEYNPAAPFNSGSPDTADQGLVETKRKGFEGVKKKREDVFKKIIEQRKSN
jgi:cyclohexyl-isocyanide hydratase